MPRRRRSRHEFIAGAEHHQATLEDLLRNFPQTRSQEAIESGSHRLPLTELSIVPCNLGDDSIVVGLDGVQRVGVLELPTRGDAAEEPAVDFEEVLPDGDGDGNPLFPWERGQG